MAASFVVIAHRGDSARAPENTLAAFDAALHNGSSHFETDVQLTQDGHCVILHDETLGRTNNGQGLAAEHTLAQLQALDAGAWFSAAHAGEQIPSLASVLERYKGRAHIHLELKSLQRALPQAVATALSTYGWDAIGPAAAGSASLFAVPGLTITSFHLEQLQRSRQVLSGVQHGWLVHELDVDIINTANQAELQQVCPRANVLTRQAVQLALQAGLSVRAWGIKTMELLTHVVECGAHGATVNWPEQARAALEKLPSVVSCEMA